MTSLKKFVVLLLALPLVFIVGYAGAATTNADLEISYHGALGHTTATVTDAESGMLEKW